MRRSSITALIVLMLTTAAVVSTQDSSAPQAPPQPTFRTGVNVIRVDVIVSDDKGNPVTDLTKDDFEIVEDGRQQTIDLFRHVSIDSGAAPDGGRTRQALSRDAEEREASRDDVRVFAILLADYHVCAGRSRLVREALSTFIRSLGPNDLIAVMNPLT
jgi:VWFA-related protein